MPATDRLRAAPAIVALGLRAVPFGPMTVLVGQVLRDTLRQNPGVLDRLGPYGARRFLLDLSDLPFNVLLQPAARRAQVLGKGHPAAADARITGTLAAFLAMLHGAEDGDALFFSGELRIDGDTAAVLALRNAIDDAELDLTGLAAARAGRLGGVIRSISARVERGTGLHLHRANPFGDVI